MTFVISAFQLYFFAFWAFFENRKNSALTPVTRTWKMTQMTHWAGYPMTQFHVWCLILGSLAHTSLSPISIGASVFAGLTGVPNTQHKRQRKTTDRATFVALGHIYRYAMWLNDESDSMTPTVSRQSRILSVHADSVLDADALYRCRLWSVCWVIRGADVVLLHVFMSVTWKCLA